MSFREISEASEFEELVKRAESEPVILFKHSTSCPISAAAHREMQNVTKEVALVVVQRARDLSNHIAQFTGVRHESPQVLILRDGKVAWHASHYDITTAEVETNSAR